MLNLTKLNSIGTLTTVELKNITVYYSYSTPVAVECSEFNGSTDKKYSVTTSKHVAQIGLNKNKIPHDKFEALLKQYNII